MRSPTSRISSEVYNKVNLLVRTGPDVVTLLDGLAAELASRTVFGGPEIDVRRADFAPAFRIARDAGLHSVGCHPPSSRSWPEPGRERRSAPRPPAARC